MISDAAKALLYPAWLLLRPHMDAAVRTHGRLAVAGRGARRGRCCEAILARPLRGATHAQRPVDVRVLRSPGAGVGVLGGGFSPRRHSPHHRVFLEGLQDGGVAARAVPFMDGLRVGIELLCLAFKPLGSVRPQTRREQTAAATLRGMTKEVNDMRRCPRNITKPIIALTRTPLRPASSKPETPVGEDREVEIHLVSIRDGGFGPTPRLALSTPPVVALTPGAQGPGE